MRIITIIVRVIIIVSLLFMLIVSICCKPTQEAQHETFDMEQQRRAEYLQRVREEENQQRFNHTRNSTAGRYEIFQHQQFQKNNTFLLDTMDGRVWMLIEDQETKKLWWTELHVENRGPYTKYDYYKSEL